jgi:hypothetical protein
MATAVEVKERQIPFSTDMVKAILSGAKTQTRRPVKPQPDFEVAVFAYEGGTHWEAWSHQVVGERGHLAMDFECPFGEPGDRLWVRETFMEQECVCQAAPAALRSSCQFCSGRGMDVIYKTDHPNLVGYKPSIHMPRWASRLTLEVIGVKVERLQDISEADALAEGFVPSVCERVFTNASSKLEPENAYYVTFPDDSETEGWLCHACATKEAGKDGRLCFGCTPESDGPAYCDECQAPLLISLTDYGIRRELRLEDDPAGAEPSVYPCRGLDAAIASMIAGGIGDLREEHHGRLAQIGFATLWDSINGKTFPWKSNPWVFAYAFRRLP